MRFALIASIVCACGVAFAGEEASVLANPTPAAPAATAAPCCENGMCARTRTRFRTVTEGCDACTGRSVRSVTRGVVRGGAEVVSNVGEAVVNVVTLPARAIRGRRCGCCCR